jgi:beta-N-acetylhexosaminidase
MPPFIRKTELLLLLLLITAGFTVPAQRSAFEELEPEAPEKTPAPDSSAAEMTAAPDDPFQKLDLRQRIAQLMIVTLEGYYTPSVDDMAFMQEYTPGGVIIRRVIQPGHAAAWTQKLRGASAPSGIPLLIGADIYRLTRRDRDAQSVYVQLPSLLSIAAAASEEATANLAALIAEHMQVMGFNMHLGPPLDLAPVVSGAEGTIHNLGSDPLFVAEAGRAIMDALRSRNILPLPMGFPGGGANRTGKNPAVLLTPRNALAEADLLPWEKAIEESVSMINVGDSLVPTLDPGNRTACLSSAVMIALLREELGFRGVVAAGPMDSSAVRRFHDVAEAAVIALQNGADMLYWNTTPNAAMRVTDYILETVKAGILEEAVINAALQRVITLKKKLAEAPEKNSQAQMKRLEGKKDLAKLAWEVERRAITLVRNRNRVLPLAKDKSMPIGVTGVIGVEELRGVMEKYAKPISMQRITTARHIDDIQSFEIERLTSHIRGIRTVVAVFTDTLRPQGVVELIHALKSNGIQVVVILLGYPELLPFLEEADAILLVYAGSSAWSQSMSAAGQILMGEGPVAIRKLGHDLQLKRGEKRIFDVQDVVRVPAGRLPVTISETFPAGLAVSCATKETVKKARWDFGAGGTSKNHKTAYAWTEAGRYPVTLTVKDSLGIETAHTFHVVVE